jgi:dienelactone hydrolase
LYVRSNADWIGGKVALISLAESEPFNAGAIVHPAMIAPEDGENLKVPLGFFPSVDEPKDVIQQIKVAMDKKDWSAKNEYHHYDTVYVPAFMPCNLKAQALIISHHGWAAARADLKHEENLKQFEDVYKRLAEYFAKNF